MSALPKRVNEESKVVPLVKRNLKDLEGRHIRPYDGRLVPRLGEENLTRYRLTAKRREDREAFWRAVDLYNSKSDYPLILPNDKDEDGRHSTNITVNASVPRALLILQCLAEAAFVEMEKGWRFE